MGTAADIVGCLVPIADQINAGLVQWINQINSLIPQTQPFNQIWGWNCPSVSKTDLIQEMQALQARVTDLADSASSPEIVAALSETPQRLTYMSQSVIGNIASTNSIHVVPAMQDEFNRLRRLLPSPLPPPLPDWEVLADAGTLPKKLTVRLRSLEARLSAIEPRTSELDKVIGRIEDAYESADKLPTDLATLAEGQREVESARTRSQSYASEANTFTNEAKTSLASVQEIATEAGKLFEQLEGVYKATATKGLARAFAGRAFWLNMSVGVWVILLMGDLGVGAYIGSERFKILETLLAQNLPSNMFWGNLTFSLLSVAAPVWFGWLATKQISQRFKLAEDYSFKASVATAYEGYRSEAVRLDPSFEKRLFGSALSRLEEPPLRFMDSENFGTPWQELTSSPAFSKALDLVPELKATVAKIIGAAAGGGAAAVTAIKALSAKPEVSSPATSDRQQETE